MKNENSKFSVEMLVKLYSQDMLRAAYSVVKSTQDSEDAVQEAFCRLIEKHPNFNDAEHAKAWLLRVTINIAKNILRARHKAIFESEIISNDPLNDTVQNVLSAVMSLPVNYRTVIFLYYYEGYEVKEIAEIIKRPVSTVTTRLSRARAKLKEILKGDYFNDE